MRLIINAANLKMGGAFQRFISVMAVYKTSLNWETHVFINEDIDRLIDTSEFPKNFRFYTLPHSPAKLLSRNKVVGKLNNLEQRINPDIVFSWVGPAYWRPRSLHLVGFGLPHLVYDDLKYVKKLNFLEKVVLHYKKWWTLREADYYVVQTDLVKSRLTDRLGVKNENIFVVQNGPGSQFLRFKKLSVKKRNQKKKLLMISTYRPSKNFEILLELHKYRYLLNSNIEIHLTIEDTIFKEKFPQNSSFFVNHGPTTPEKCPELYSDCDVMILPSHLECFSASYVESMFMGLPIVTSDLPFARDVCGDAALYFNNVDVKDLVTALNTLLDTSEIYSKLVENGARRVSKFHDANSQAELYLKTLRFLVQ